MTRGDDKRVGDILGAADEIASIVAMGRSRFESDPVVRRAAERLLDIIGTAAGALSHELVEANPGLEVGKAEALRNLLSHEYWRSDDGILWQTITSSVPEFAERLSAVSSP
ncbi:MAG: DUF86 domain-containing protein [Acidimicrobiaceae bacterium]|nr:DUF86 domain-containing protein [Acidimicrobiaceae bacterium]MYJ80609.1 DUF86 domain-containing protein [Acidimicrobiaceae bacterium]